MVIHIGRRFLICVLSGLCLAPNVCFGLDRFDIPSGSKREAFAGARIALISGSAAIWYDFAASTMPKISAEALLNGGDVLIF